nr:MAG TPA: hypothetical protein [Caudoviricetes sp.]
MNEVVPQNCPFYKGITKCTVFNCMFNIFGVCTKPRSGFYQRKNKTYKEAEQ